MVTGTLLAGELRDRLAIIIDDLISTGGTLLRSARACRDAGARSVWAAATHGLFVGEAAAMVNDPLFDGLVISDTVPPFRLDAGLVAQRPCSIPTRARLTRINAGAATRP